MTTIRNLPTAHIIPDQNDRIAFMGKPFKRQECQSAAKALQLALATI